LNYSAKSSVEYTDDGSTFHALPDMPEAKYHHCMAVLKGGDIFVVGGDNSTTCFLFENGKKQWKKCQAMVTGRSFASCAWSDEES
jgi:hypothetical protein